MCFSTFIIRFSVIIIRFQHLTFELLNNENLIMNVKYLNEADFIQELLRKNYNMFL